MANAQSNFPPEFLWGAATSAYQIEGAAAIDGRGPSIWDVFCHTPGKTVDGHTGDIACDHYRRFRDDIALMRRLNLHAYRFSVSWSRVLPQGRGAVNSFGLDFYDRLVDALCAAGIEPMVTLYHWDLPAALQMEIGGWLSPDIAPIFADYAEVIFRRLGDRVRLWLTLNEPWCSVDGGYFSGLHAPGARNRACGYQAGHNLLRAHAHAVAAYAAHRNSNGRISLALNVHYGEPASEAPEDIEAAERAMIGFAGWFGDPLFYGDYPAEMRARLGSLLPAFSTEDVRLMRGSMDFMALNYYLTETIRNAPDAIMGVETVPRPDLPHSGMNWPIVPDGFRKMLLWLAARYPGLPFYITENGACFEDVPDETGFVLDQNRVDYLREHIAAMRRAMTEGVDVRGYFAWSLMDNFEWTCGYHKRFGLVRCDFDTQRRTVKASGEWYARLISESAPERALESEPLALARGL